MPYNGSGTYVRPAGQPVVAGTDILDTVFNDLTADLATALTTCVTRDGQSPATANLPMGGNKITGLAAAQVAGDAVRYEQVSTSAALAALVGDETGSGALVFATSPTLVTPALGTPTSGVLTNCTGTAAGLTAGAATTATNSTSAVNVTGSAVVSGAVQSGTNPKFNVVLTGDQNFSSGVGAKITFNSRVFDIGSFFDTATNNRYQPNVAGYYRFSWCAEESSATLSVTAAQTFLYKTGGLVADGSMYGSGGAAMYQFNSVGSTIIYLNGTTDYVELFATITGTSPKVSANSGRTYFCGELIP